MKTSWLKTVAADVVKVGSAFVKELPIFAPLLSLLPAKEAAVATKVVTAAGQDINDIFSAITDAQIMAAAVNAKRAGAITGDDLRQIVSVRVTDLIGQAAALKSGDFEFSDPVQAAADIDTITGKFADLAHNLKKK